MNDDSIVFFVVFFYYPFNRIIQILRTEEKHIHVLN